MWLTVEYATSLFPIWIILYKICRFSVDMSGMGKINWTERIWLWRIFYLFFFYFTDIKINLWNFNKIANTQWFHFISFTFTVQLWRNVQFQRNLEKFTSHFAGETFKRVTWREKEWPKSLRVRRNIEWLCRRNFTALFGKYFIKIRHALYLYRFI